MALQKARSKCRPAAGRALRECAILAAIMRPALFASLVIYAATPVAILAQTCAQTDLRPFIQRVQAAQSQLRAHKGEVSVSEPLQGKIHLMKDALAALADAAMKCAPGTLNEKALEGSFVKPLDANKPVVMEEYDPNKPDQFDDIYGNSIDVKVTRPAEQPQILFVDFHFEIQCGFDSLLLAYEFRDGSWHRILRWESPAYDEIGGAFGDFFDYLVFPQTDSKNLFVAVAHGHPWCSSNMSAFDLDILQPVRDGTPQQVLFHKKAIYSRANYPIFHKMKAKPDGFELRLEAYSMDMNIVFRPVIYSYRVSNNQFVRVQPIAMNGRDFVDEWLQSEWSESKNWSSLAAVAKLEAAHKKIKSLRDSSLGAKEWPNFTYGPVRPCSDSASHFQVELDKGWWVEEKKDWRPDTPTFFQIQEGKNSFTMLSASDKHDPHCTGHDIMPKQ
jgi:hypothetical protein